MAKVAIIDDDRDFVDSIHRVLRGRGHEVIAIYDVDGAVKQLESNPPDAVILDVMFPEDISAGFRLAQEIRQHRTLSRLPVLILSAVNTKFPLGFGPGDIDPAWMPVQDFLEKPVDFETLVEKVEKLAVGRSASRR